GQQPTHDRHLGGDEDGRGRQGAVPLPPVQVHGGVGAGCGEGGAGDEGPDPLGGHLGPPIGTRGACRGHGVGSASARRGPGVVRPRGVDPSAWTVSRRSGPLALPTAAAGWRASTGSPAVAGTGTCWAGAGSSPSAAVAAPPGTASTV